MNGQVAVLNATVYNIESAPELSEPTITFHFIEEDDSKHEQTDKVYIHINSLISLLFHIF